MLRLRPCIIGTDGVCWPTCASPSLISVRHIASSLRDSAGTAVPVWLQLRFLLAVLNFARLHSLTPAVWCGFTVLVSRPPARMLCDTPCHLPSLFVCHLSVLGSRAGVLVVTCRGRSRSSYWYVPSPLSHLLRHFLHLLCSVCRMPLRCGGSICAAVAPCDHARARGARLL